MTRTRVLRVPIAALAIGVILAGCTSANPGKATTVGSGANGSSQDLDSSVDVPGFDWAPDRTGGFEPRPCGDDIRCVGGAGEYSTIGDAIDAAKDGDTIQVAAGDYSEQIAIESLDVTVLGGFSNDFSARDPEANETTIDGGRRGTTVLLSDAKNSTVDGFTVTGGKADLDEWGSGGGSGILVTDSGEVTLSRNLIKGNDDEADYNSCDCHTFGGGIQVQNTTSVVISDNIVRDNTALRGGGISVAGLATIERNLVEDNHGNSDHGGGLYLTGDGMVLRGNLVRGNTIGDEAGYGWGGGGIFYGDDVAERPKIRVEGNRWVSNVAPGRGSGFFLDEGVEGTIVGDLYYANACYEGGAGIYVDGGHEFGSIATISQVTVTGSNCGDDVHGSGVYAEGGSRFDLTESIVAGNGGASDVNHCAADICTEAPDVEPSTVANSIIGAVDGDVESKDGIDINPAPAFRNPDGGDFSVEGTTWGA